MSFREFFAEKGVLHQYNCIEKRQRNSIVERKHHLLNVAQALFFQLRIPIKFWSKCVMTAAYLINKTPSPILQQMPYEVLHVRPTDYSISEFLVA